MEQLEATADVVVALGTSLSGMNADRMVTTPAARGGPVVIVGLQQTQLDHLSTVRIFAKIDDFARMLCEEMQCSVPEEQVNPVYTFPGENQETEVYTVPYSREDGRWSGCENESDVEEKMSGVLGTMELDLSDGAHVVLTVGPHQGMRFFYVSSHMLFRLFLSCISYSLIMFSIVFQSWQVMWEKLLAEIDKDIT